MKQIHSPHATLATKAPTGIVGFDEITGGGLPRARTTLLVGGPGSGKTILALQFLAHGAQACNEPGIFAAFEEASSRIVANADSFGWNLTRLLKQKKLFFLDAQPQPDLIQSGNFDLGGMLAALAVQIETMGARRIVFDALDVVLALLSDPAAQRREIYRLHEWLLARELILSDAGVTLADTYTAGGEVLMGTLRWEKERAERVASETAEAAAKLKRVRLDAEEAELEVRVKSLQTELVAKQVEKALLVRSTQSHAGELSRGRTQMKELRGADATNAKDQENPA